MDLYRACGMLNLGSLIRNVICNSSTGRLKIVMFVCVFVMNYGVYTFYPKERRKSMGEVTPAMVQRAGNISGAIGHDLVRLFVKNVGTGYWRKTTTTIPKEAGQSKAVCDNVSTYKDDALVENIRGRKLAGAETFEYSVEFKGNKDSEKFD